MATLESTPIRITGVDINDPASIRAAQLSKALGHPVRLAILKLLTKQENCFCYSSWPTGGSTGIDRAGTCKPLFSQKTFWWRGL